MLVNKHRVAVIIPCYRVRDQILSVLGRIGPYVHDIYVVDDCCPDRTIEHVTENAKDPRIKYIANRQNLGVGGATKEGMKQAITDGATILIKLDGDGQMDPRLIPKFIAPILSGTSDFTKGNRFYFIAGVKNMPITRIVGNGLLSFIAKLSTGYWNIFDPTNGFFALHSIVAEKLPFESLSNRYYFETDLLFRLNLLHARVVDVPMSATYGDEKSSLRPFAQMLPFLVGHIRNMAKRIFYNYFVRDFNIGSVDLIFGVALLVFGAWFGFANWSIEGEPASAGTVMLAALPIIIGFQMVLGFLNFDVANVPKEPIHPIL